MRKLLLASAAMLGATTGLASAQTAAPNPAQGQIIAPYGAFGGSLNNNNNIAAAVPGAVAIPTPGTVVIHLNGRMEVDVTANFTSLDRATTSGATYKVQPVGVGSFLRLYPGIDGLTTNGIRYGASAEIRENFMSGASYGATTAAGASGNTSAETLFVRRAFTYIANDQAGILRFGQADGLIGLLDGGVTTTANWDAGLGNINGGPLQAVAPANTAVPYVWLSAAGNEYGNNKIVYLSPKFFGFDAGLQYAPSMGNSFSNGVTGSPYQATACVQAGPGCINLSSGGDATRWLNQYAAGIRYTGAFGPVAIRAYGMYEGAGKENLNVASVLPSPVAAPQLLKYDNLSFVSAGAAATFAGFTLAANYIGGALNGQLNMRPSGGKSENAELVGLAYTAGPLTLGANFGMIDSQGDARLVGISQRHEIVTSFGGNYVLAPGLQLVAEYLYSTRHQGQYNFVAGSTTTKPGENNSIKTQGVVVSTVVTW